VEDKDMGMQIALQGEVLRLPMRLVDYRHVPSARKDELYKGFRVLDVKWWSATLSDEMRAQVRRAIRFDHRVAVLDAFLEFTRAARHLRRSELVPAASKLARVSVRWALITPLMTYRSRVSRPIVGPPAFDSDVCAVVARDVVETG
jgi:hypothetical protein